LCNVAGYAVVSVTYSILRFPFKVFYAIFVFLLLKWKKVKWKSQFVKFYTDNRH
jgi:hypothetical protein